MSFRIATERSPEVWTRTKEKSEEEQKECEESIVHGHHEIVDFANEDNGSTSDHDQNWRFKHCHVGLLRECYCGMDLCRCPLGLVTFPSPLCL